MEVTEQLGTLSVACEAAGREGGCGMGEGDASLPSVMGRGLSVASGAAGEGLPEAGPSAAVPDRGAVGGQSPSPSPGPSELPALDGWPSNGPASSGSCTWPGFSPVAGGEAGSGGVEERSRGPAQAEGPPRSLSPLERGCPASCLGLHGSPDDGVASERSTSAGTEREGERAARSSADVFAVEKQLLADEGGRSSSESDSSSDSDTDTDSSSSVSSISSCSPVLPEDGVQQDKKDENSPSIGGKSELSEDKSFPVEDLTILLPESVELMPIGNVSSIIENLVIVESLKGLPPVNEDSVLFKEDRYSIGKVFEVFGPVSHPFYALQFKNPEHIETKGIKIHDAVYFAPSVESFTQYIFPEKIKQDKGSDASWKNDEEPPPEALDFSDDEKEKVAKQQKKSQNLRRKKFKSQDESNDNGIHYQPRRHYPSNYSSESLKGELNPCFSRGRFPVHPHAYRQHVKPLQRYCSDYMEFQKPSAFRQHQNMGRPGRQQHSFPSPSFGTVSNAANPFPPSSPTWRWPHGCIQNTYDPLLSLLSLPPPPPPPPAAPPNNTNLV
ncbi:H/ACA ribonucleoprotein complex non-core subunit NAF1 [Eublepharis macularius]|uniref:H/ACA ribonucleoprotein complex non-core subunit NAF1 n=1 Tax=Eublepharis macularius TaxID=481883 RepID=A0AA97JY55_EUBMA|nr:H/ACA ribonucleoprotein complex non-core subunit NAF1 [Eublepharis macularius]